MLLGSAVMEAFYCYWNDYPTPNNNYVISLDIVKVRIEQRIVCYFMKIVYNNELLVLVGYMNIEMLF